MKHFENYCLREYIALKNLVYVKNFYIVETLDELKNLLRNIRIEDKSKIRILGSGTNLLINDNYNLDLVVIKLSGDFKFFKIDKKNELFFAYSGVILQAFITKLLINKLSGMEVLAGIPGTIGGAVFGNAGTKYGEISNFVKKIFLLDFFGNEKIIDIKENIDQYFGYRKNFFANSFNFIIYKVEFGNFLYNNDAIMLYKKFFSEKIASQPYDYKSLGCVFKNPKNSLSAGHLIDFIGMKHYKIGNVFVSEKYGTKNTVGFFGVL